MPTYRPAADSSAGGLLQLGPSAWKSLMNVSGRSDGSKSAYRVVDVSTNARAIELR
jgi:hypothetical protein